MIHTIKHMKQITTKTDKAESSHNTIFMQISEIKMKEKKNSQHSHFSLLHPYFLLTQHSTPPFQLDPERVLGSSFFLPLSTLEFLKIQLKLQTRIEGRVVHLKASFFFLNLHKHFIFLLHLLDSPNPQPRSHVFRKMQKE